jgi:uncharacterized membrane protein YeaQ/YmgE (transglycosylase-associated protein family)
VGDRQRRGRPDGTLDEPLARHLLSECDFRNGGFRRMTIIAWIVLGLIAGWLAGMLMKGGGYGIVGDIVLGILGAIVGGWLTGLVLGRDLMTGFNIESLIVAVIGAVVLVAISRLFTGSRASNRV